MLEREHALGADQRLDRRCRTFRGSPRVEHDQPYVSAHGRAREVDRLTSLFAHLVVAEADDDPALPSLVVTVLVDEDDGQNPVALLDTLLDEGRTGWIDVGLADDPIGLSRVLVLVVATLLAIAAFVVIRRGLGHTSARR
jgi:hypothetical protein